MHQRPAIAAIATPVGEGGIAVILISGADAIRIAESIFHDVRAAHHLPEVDRVRGDLRELGTVENRFRDADGVGTADTDYSDSPFTDRSGDRSDGGTLMHGSAALA